MILAVEAAWRAVQRLESKLPALEAEIAVLRARLALFLADEQGFARLEGTVQAAGDGWALDHGAIYRPDDSPKKLDLRDLL